LKLSKGTMRTYLIIFPSPWLYQYPGFLQSSENFPVRQFISESAVKNCNITVLPGVARFEIRSLDR
jgi:hypothetical protein